MPRFALLDHDHPFPHWDLLLEREGSLWTWRLPLLFISGEVIVAERIGNHRLIYLEYEGPVRENRGRVLRLDGGELRWLHADERRIEVELRGSVYQGRLEGTAGEADQWSFLYRSF